MAGVSALKAPLCHLQDWRCHHCMQVGPGRDSGSQDAALYRGSGRGSYVLKDGSLGRIEVFELLGRNV